MYFTGWTQKYSKCFFLHELYVVSLETTSWLELSYEYLGDKLYTIFTEFWGMLIFSNNFSPMPPAAVSDCSPGPFSQPLALLQRCLCQYDRFYACSLREMQTSRHLLHKKKTWPKHWCLLESFHTKVQLLHIYVLILRDVCATESIPIQVIS